jgi:hypothetical protein
MLCGSKSFVRVYLWFSVARRPDENQGFGYNNFLNEFSTCFLPIVSTQSRVCGAALSRYLNNIPLIYTFQSLQPVLLTFL